MNDKLTLVKIGGENHQPSPGDLEKWRDILEKAKTDPDFQLIVSRAESDKEISIEEIDVSEDPDYVTLVKVNTDSNWVSKKDLEAWREIFEEAQKDPDFTIFTHSGVSVERVKVGRDTRIIVGDAIVV